MSVLLFALGFALGVGILVLANYPMELLVRWLRRKSDVGETRSAKEKGVPVEIVGSFERILAFVLVLFDIPSTGTILTAWIAAKLAASWQRYPTGDKSNEYGREYRVGSLIALMAGIVSVGLGCLVGLAVRYLTLRS
jgi:ABC-type Fe3+ transport system permease subunit